MMSKLRLVIVEDEPATARNLAYVLQNLARENTVTAMLSTVKEAVSWFKANPNAYDLIFMDIRLADGVSFDIFKGTAITRPVIFVTAYNDYAIQAFKNNGIDYILKPFDEQEVEQALNKFKNLFTKPDGPAINTGIEALFAQLNQLTKPYKRSFLIHFREKLVPVEAEKIAWFYTANEVVYAHTLDAREYHMEFTMEELSAQLDPQQFFRANRQFIINRKAITEVDFYFNGRLSVKVNPKPAEQILISKARVPEFKSWMNS